MSAKDRDLQAKGGRARHDCESCLNARYVIACVSLIKRSVSLYRSGIAIQPRSNQVVFHLHLQVSEECPIPLHWVGADAQQPSWLLYHNGTARLIL